MFIKRFLKKEKFDNYDDYIQNAVPVVPENFNFAYDVLDVMADETPDKVAVLWVNDTGDKKVITFKMLSEMSGRVANFLSQQGIKKGDAVLLFMRRRWEYWVLMMAMHRIGAIPIPSTNQLKSEDIKFRIKTAGVKNIIANQGETVNLLAGVNAIDVDGLPLKVTVSDTVDFNAPGTYNISYSATGVLGITEKVSATVTIKEVELPKPPEDTEAPEDTEIPEDTQVPENTEIPEDTEKPEDVEDSEGTQAPEAMEL
jgi:acyl-CoA synthetase (AMP-forming)/AMP-acid ligase II